MYVCVKCECSRTATRWWYNDWSFSTNCRRQINKELLSAAAVTSARIVHTLIQTFLPRFLLGLACFLRLPRLSSVIITPIFGCVFLFKFRFKKVVHGGSGVSECVFVLSACLRMNGDEASPSVTAGHSDLDGTPELQRRRAVRRSDVSSRGWPWGQALASLAYTFLIWEVDSVWKDLHAKHMINKYTRYTFTSYCPEFAERKAFMYLHVSRDTLSYMIFFFFFFF